MNISQCDTLEVSKNNAELSGYFVGNGKYDMYSCLIWRTFKVVWINSREMLEGEKREIKIKK